MRQIACFLAALCVFAGMIRADDVSRDVHLLLDTIEKAWADHDIRMLTDCCAESGMMAIFSRDGEQGALLLDQQASLALVEQNWAPVVTHRFVERDIVIDGDVAWIHALLINELVEHKTNTTRVINIAVKQNGKWGMCFSMPALYSPAIVVEAVVDGSQANKLGLQPGDIIRSYADQPVHVVRELLDTITLHKAQSSNKELALVIKRAERDLTFKVQPGSLGIQVADRLAPAPDTAFYDKDQTHPVLEVMDDLFAGYVTADVDRVMSCVSEAGFMAIDTSGGTMANLKPRHLTIPILYGRAGFARALPSRIAEERQAVDFAGARMLEPRVIAGNDVAVATSRFTAPMRDGNGTMNSPAMLQVHLRQAQQWRLAAILPYRATAGLDTENTGNIILKKDLEQRLAGKMVGIGVALKPDLNGARIDNILPEGPAASSSLKIGQVITAVDGTPIAGLDMREVVNRITGPENSTVTLTIDDHGNTQTVAIIRKSFALKSVQAEMIQQHVMVVKITQFHDQTLAEVNDVLARCDKEQALALVLDLRVQGGGQPDVVAEVADLFLPARKRLWITRMNNEQPRPTISKTPPKSDLPIVVLIGEHTLGGSELLASALHENQRATLMGQPTKGVARLRQAVDQPDGQTRIVDRGIFLARPGTPITDTGISPDIQLPTNLSPQETLEKAIDSAVKR